MTVSMLTTVDNPFDPFIQFDDWQSFDHLKGYYTAELVDRFTETSPELPIEMQNQANDEAIDRIVNLFGTDLYKICTKDY